MLVGVISDTHGLLRPQAISVLRKADHILHAGDVGNPAILRALSTLAPITAIRGNVDVEGPCAALPATEAIELGGKLFYLVHSIRDLDIKPEQAGISVVVSGHSHRSSLSSRNSVLYLNPGSAGPCRFSLQVTLATVAIGDEIVAKILTLQP